MESVGSRTESVMFLLISLLSSGFQMRQSSFVGAVKPISMKKLKTEQESKNREKKRAEMKVKNGAPLRE